LQIASEEIESQHKLRSAAERKADDLEAALGAASSTAREAIEVRAKPLPMCWLVTSTQGRLGPREVLEKCRLPQALAAETAACREAEDKANELSAAADEAADIMAVSSVNKSYCESLACLAALLPLRHLLC